MVFIFIKLYKNLIQENIKRKEIKIPIFTLFNQIFYFFLPDVLKQSVVITSRRIPLLPVRQRPDVPRA